MKGKLIVLEGIDGSGKETQSNLLEKKLKEKGREVMHISFPDYESPSSALVKCTLKGTLEKSGRRQSLRRIPFLRGGSFCILSHEVEGFL